MRTSRSLLPLTASVLALTGCAGSPSEPSATPATTGGTPHPDGDTHRDGVGRPGHAARDWRSNLVSANDAGVRRGRCAGDPPPVPMPGQADVLPYGSSIIIGPVGCRSAALGIACMHLTSGYGMFLARDIYQTYGPY